MKYHFLGIAGHAMVGVALAVRSLGHEVTGTDDGAGPPGTDTLDAAGITWWSASDSSHVDGVDEVIISGHTQPTHPEVVAAQQQNIPIKSFAQLVGELTTQAHTIVISGTHGKTTTTALLAWIFETAGRQPDYLIGIKPHNFDTSVRLTGSEVAIIEGDEYRASQLETTSKFQYYHPDVLVITSIEMDHPDFFTDIDDLADRFRRAVLNMPPHGTVYYDDSYPLAGQASLGKLAEQRYWYNDSVEDGGIVDFRAEGIYCSVRLSDGTRRIVSAPLYGRHNVKNVRVAVMVAHNEGISDHHIEEALASFSGASRRFERVSNPKALVTVIDDYAHHPTEVATTINAAKRHFAGRVLAVFRPHTYSRTKELLPEYRRAFKDADQAFIAPIEGAREQHLAATVSGADIAAGAGEQVHYCDTRESVINSVVAAAQPGDVVLCMTVSPWDGLAAELAEQLG